MSDMVIDPCALAFEIELKAANTKCNNCGKVGMSCVSTDAGSVVFASQLICDVEIQCFRCSCRYWNRIVFEKGAKFCF